MIPAGTINPVILNVFQDPFLPERRREVLMRNGTVVQTSARTVPMAGWVLKQVQHDEDKGGRA